MVSTNIQKKIIEFGMILLEIPWKKRGCMGIPKLMILIVRVLYFLLITWCLISQTKKFFQLHYTPMPTKWLVLQTNGAIVSTKMQTLVIIGEPPYSKQKYIKETLSLFCFCIGNFFNDMDFEMVPLAWTTHAQGIPQLPHCLSFSFTFPTLFIFELLILFAR